MRHGQIREIHQKLRGLKKSKADFIIKDYFEHILEKRKKGYIEKKLSENKKKENIIEQEKDNFYEKKRIQNENQTDMYEKVKEACKKDLIKRKQVIYKRARVNTEENDKDIELIREQFLLPKYLLEEIDIYQIIKIIAHQ